MSSKDKSLAPDPTDGACHTVLYARESPHGDPNLVFAPSERAVFVDRLHRAIGESKTWGEFRRRMPPGEIARVFEDVFSPATDKDTAEDAEYYEPADSAEFSSEAVPGFSDGDYPPWIASEQGRYLPPHVLTTFGSRRDTFVNGSFWALPAAKYAEIVSALAADGFTIVRRDDLLFW